jgi:hypothetical protein
VPDTGIQSLKTLIEYKFMSKQEDIQRITDEILVDSRGYVSSEWLRLFFVIYETNRFQTEKQWNQHLRQCGISENTKVIVLEGEPCGTKKKSQGGRKKAH